MTILEGLRHTTCGLPDHLEMVYDPDLEHLVRLKGFQALRVPSFDFSDGFQNIVQTIPIRSHKGVASR